MEEKKLEGSDVGQVEKGWLDGRMFRLSPHVDLRPKKVELADFNGENPALVEWMMQAQRYFDLSQITEDEQRLELTYCSMAGEALIWYTCEDRDEPFADWKDFKVRALRQFVKGHSGSVYKELMELKQTGSVMEYRRRFDQIQAPSSRADDHEFRKAAFLSGLKPEIAEIVRLLKELGLRKIMEKAQWVERMIQSRTWAGLWMTPHDEPAEAAAAAMDEEHGSSDLESF